MTRSAAAATRVDTLARCHSLALAAMAAAAAAPDPATQCGPLLSEREDLLLSAFPASARDKIAAILAKLPAAAAPLTVAAHIAAPRMRCGASAHGCDGATPRLSSRPAGGITSGR